MRYDNDISRRSFVRNTGVAMAALAAGSLSGVRAEDNPAKKWHMKLTTSSVMFDELPIENVCEIVSRLGLPAVDIWAPFQRCTHLADIKTRLGGKGLRELMIKHKLEVSAFTSYLTPYSDYWELIRDYGGGIVVRGADAGREAEPKLLVPRMKKLFENLKPDIELARKGNARLAIENHNGSLLNSYDSFKAFVELNPDPEHVGIAIAPYHIQRYQTPVAEFIKTAGSQCLFVYAWQNGKGTAQMPGVGPADFKPWLEALAAIDYPHYSTIFMHGHPAANEMEALLAKSKKYLLGQTG